MPHPTSDIVAILPAAGSGTRFGSHQNKLFASLAGKPIWVHSASRIASHPEVSRVVLSVAQHDWDVFQIQAADFGLVDQVDFVVGGAERTDSVLAGLDAMSESDSVPMVAIHDAARPLIGTADLDAVFAKARRSKAAILATPVTGTVKRSLTDDQSCTTVDRRELWIAMTPQVFDTALLRASYARYRGRPATDDSQLVERFGHPVAIVRGNSNNLKITTPEDLLLAEALLK